MHAEPKKNAERRTSNAGLRKDSETCAATKDASKYDLEERLLEFAARILCACRVIEKSRAGDHVSDQLARSGTSPMPHHGEAESSRSRKDFINKIKIGLQELRESRRWLQLTVRTPLVEKPTLLESLIEENLELIKIFRASIKTAETNA